MTMATIDPSRFQLSGVQTGGPVSTPIRQQDPNAFYAQPVSDPRQLGNFQQSLSNFTSNQGGFGGQRGGFGGGFNPMMGGFGGGFNPMMGGFGGGFNPMMGGFGGGFNPMMGGYGGFGGFGGFNPMMGGLGGLGGYGMFGGRFNPQMGGRFGFGRQPQVGQPDYRQSVPDYADMNRFNQPQPMPQPQPSEPMMYAGGNPNFDMTGGGGMGGDMNRFNRPQPQPMLPPPSEDITDYRKLYGEPQAAMRQQMPQQGSMMGSLFSGLGGFRSQFPQYQYQPSIEFNPSVDVTDRRKFLSSFS